MRLLGIKRPKSTKPPELLVRASSNVSNPMEESYMILGSGKAGDSADIVGKNDAISSTSLHNKSIAVYHTKGMTDQQIHSHKKDTSASNTELRSNPASLTSRNDTISAVKENESINRLLNTVERLRK